jgi:hypothetical protein
MKPMSLTSPEVVAREYGGNKRKIAEAARIGLLDPTLAVMAGMFIDKMRSAASAEQAQNTTVAQDILGLGGASAAQMAMAPQGQPMQPQGQPMPQQAAPEEPPMTAAGGGLLNLPAGNVGNYAGGGIVAFDEGGEVPGYAGDKGSLIDPEFRGGDPNKTERLRILKDELTAEQGKLANPNLPKEERARTQSNIDALNREIANASKSAPTRVDSFSKPNTAGVGNITKYPQGDPRIAAQREAMSLPAISPPTQATPSNEDLVARATGVAEQIYPKGEMPTALNVQTALAESNQFLKDAGVDLDFYIKQDKDLEKEGATFAKDREEAKTFRILQGAAGILSGTSPFASVNIGKGVAPAVEGLAADLKEFNKNERALRDAQRKLRADQQQFNISRATDARNRMVQSQERVDRLAGKKIDLIGDITKSFISTQGSKEVAEVYGKSYTSLEELRQKAPPDTVKALTAIVDKLRPSMPNSSEQQLLQAAASILRPERAAGATIGAISKARQDASKIFQEMKLMDRPTKELKKKADAGDKEAKKQLDDLEQEIFEKELGRLPFDMSGAPRGGAEAPGGTTKPGQFSVTAPNGKVYYFPNKEQADAFKAQIGG